MNVNVIIDNDLVLQSTFNYLYVVEDRSCKKDKRRRQAITK